MDDCPGMLFGNQPAPSQRRKRSRSSGVEAGSESRKQDAIASGDSNTTKITKFGWAEEELKHRFGGDHQIQVFSCSLPPQCSLSRSLFSTAQELDAHYQKHHAHMCHTCNKIFPDERFLDLHLSEFHDPLVSLRKERGEKTVCRFSHAMEPC